MREIGERFDPRTSPRHKPFLETPGTLAYLPLAVRWMLSPEVLLVALVFGAMLGVFAASWLGVFFVALFGSVALSWLLTIQSHAIFGFGDSPPMTIEHIDIYRSHAETMIEVGAMIAAGYGVLYLGEPTLARWYAWTIGAALPSIFALVAVEGAIVPALDPRRILRVMRASGGVGLLLAAGSAWGLERACWVSAEFISMLDAGGIAAVMSGWTADAGSALTGMGLVVVAAFLVHLHGHALHHRHERAGLAVVLAAMDDEERAAAACARRVIRVVDGVAEAKARNDLAAAERWIAEDAPEGVDMIVYLDALWDALLARHLQGAAVRVARRLVPAAVAAKRYQLAAEVWRSAKRMSPSFRLDADTAARFLEQARARGDAALIDELTG